MTAVLRSARLQLDEVRPGDVEEVLRYCQNDELQRWVPLPSPYLRKDAEFFTGPYAADAATSTAFSLWAIRPSGASTLVGAIELRFEELDSSTVGFWLGAEHRGTGIMTEALALLVDYAFSADGLALTRMHWQAVAGNTASAVVAQRNGFRFEGTSRASLPHRGIRFDSWEATLLSSDSRSTTAGWPT